MGRVNVYRKIHLPSNSTEIIDSLRVYGQALNEKLESSSWDHRHYATKALKIERPLGRVSGRFLPPHLRERGYDRLESVFAFPFSLEESIIYPSSKKEQTVIVLEVDSDQAIVTPMETVSKLYEDYINPRDWLGLAELYWSSAITLEEFKENFFDNGDYIYFSRRGNKRIEIPEVLIPKWSIKDIVIINPPQGAFT